MCTDNNKLALKARHYNVVGVIVHLLKTNIKNATALPVVLSFIRILAVNCKSIIYYNISSIIYSY